MLSFGDLLKKKAGAFCEIEICLQMQLLGPVTPDLGEVLSC